MFESILLLIFELFSWQCRCSRYNSNAIVFMNIWRLKIMLWESFCNVSVLSDIGFLLRIFIHKAVRALLVWGRINTLSMISSYAIASMIFYWKVCLFLCYTIILCSQPALDCSLKVCGKIMVLQLPFSACKCLGNWRGL